MFRALGGVCTRLASDIGNGYLVDDLSDFVSKGHFSPVVIDWAWITYHWDRSADTADIPRVMHGEWRSQQGAIGYVLVNWTGGAEKMKFILVCPGGSRRIRRWGL